MGFSGDYGGTYFMTKLIGAAKARELYLLSERIDAFEAERLGLGPDDPSFKPSRRVIETRLLDYVGQASRGVPDGSVTTDPELVATATAMLDRLVELHLPRQPRSLALRDSLMG